MQGYWLLFASLTVVGSVIYNVTMKFGTANLNAFTFVFISSFSLVTAQTTALLIARYGFGIDVGTGLSTKTIMWSLVCGLGLALIDIAYFFALRYGTLIQGQAFWTIGGTIALACVSIIFFNESMTMTKLIGLVLGIVSLFLIIRS